VHHFTIVSRTDGPLGDEHRDLLQLRIREAVPFAGAATDERIFLSGSGRTLVAWMSNEATFESAMGIDPGESLGPVIPLYYGEVVDHRALFRLKWDATIHRSINQMSGRFCGGVVDLDEDAFALGTTLVRLEPLYYGEQDGVVVVSTWASVAYSCLRALRPGDRTSGRMYSFLNAGFFGDDDTFYGGVQAVPAYATIRLRAGRLDIESEFFEYLCNPTTQDVGLPQMVADALVEGCTPLAELGEVPLSLSGGKDSRLLLAGLRAAGLSVHATTMSGGSHNFTDVYCATLVAKQTGIRHTIQPLVASQGEATISAERFYQRTRDILLASDCGIISLGNMGYSKVNSRNAVLNGLGGELLRGGYSKGLNKVKTVFTPHSLLVSKWGRFAALFHAEAVADYESRLQGWLDSAPHELNVPEAADFGYLYCRMGRWGAAQTRTGVLSRRPIYPLLDNKFMSLVYSAPVESRTNDRLLYLVMKRLDDALAALPLANDYWAFQGPDEVAELKHAHPDAFLPRGAPEAGENLDWRANWIGVLGDALRRRLLEEHPDSPIYEVVDFEKLRRLFDDGKVNYGHRFPLFAMYAASIVFAEGL